MILALVTPHYFPSVRGNSVTVQRIESGLREQGLGVSVFSLDRQDREAIRAGLGRLRPDLVHGFHARAAGPLVVEVARELGIPAVVTLTGTDVNVDLGDPERRPAVLEVLRGATALVVFHRIIRDRVLAEAPEVASRTHVIHQTALCQEGHYDLRGTLGLGPEAFVFFQPSGIRRVKNIPAAIPPLTALHRRFPRVRYVLAGPQIEAAEANRVLALLDGLSWAFYLGELRHEAICASLRQVDAVINSSLSEGGMPNAVLEAMSRGVPVLASDIEGHRTILEDGQDGFLFGSPQEFLAKAARLLTEPATAKALGERARQKMATQFTLAGEIGGYLALYRSLLGTGG